MADQKSESNKNNSLKSIQAVVTYATCTGISFGVTLSSLVLGLICVFFFKSSTGIALAALVIGVISLILALVLKGLENKSIAKLYQEIPGINQDISQEK